MCGIFGILDHKSRNIVDVRRLAASAALLRHRGPDHEGIHADHGVGLVHTRLSLLDLHARSNQPLWDTHGRYALVYNGEIYNFGELRSELKRESIEFRTSSDTEVLLKLLLARGIWATVSRLEGMFAFALYDKTEQSLFLARDRFGIKPLYVYDQEDLFIFASEIQAMRPWIKFEPDLLSISGYLQGRAQYRLHRPMNGCSFFKQIKIVAPGNIVTVQQGGRAHYKRYFSLGEFFEPQMTDRLARLKSAQVADELEERLLNSIRMQLLADTPVGAFCSGGVDSSLLIAMASRFHNNLAIFHADVRGVNSERDAAVMLAKHLRLDLKAVEVVDQDSIEMMPEVIAHYGYPYVFHPESVPFLMVSRLTQRHGTKAVLTGEGADECFMGYDWSVFNLRRYIKELPLRSYHMLPKVLRLLTLGRRRELRISLRKLSDGNPRLFTPALTASVPSLQYRFESELEYEDICAHMRSGGDRQPDSRRVQTLDLMSHVLRSLLHRNDCLGMAAGLEARFPFLDSRVVKLAANMPYRHKVRFSPAVLEREHPFLRDKWALREVAARYLPARLSQRKKRGFPTDAQSRLDIGKEYFDGSYVADLFELDRKATRYLVEHSNLEMMRRLLHLDVWAHVCLHSEPRSAIVAKLRKHVRVRPQVLVTG